MKKFSKIKRISALWLILVLTFNLVLQDSTSIVLAETDENIVLENESSESDIVAVTEDGDNDNDNLDSSKDADDNNTDNNNAYDNNADDNNTDDNNTDDNNTGDNTNSDTIETPDNNTDTTDNKDNTDESADNTINNDNDTTKDDTDDADNKDDNEEIQYTWTGMTVEEFATWFLDENNVEEIKEVLNDDSTDQYSSLRSYIDDFLEAKSADLTEDQISYLKENFDIEVETSNEEEPQEEENDNWLELEGDNFIKWFTSEDNEEEIKEILSIEADLDNATDEQLEKYNALIEKIQSILIDDNDGTEELAQQSEQLRKQLKDSFGIDLYYSWLEKDLKDFANWVLEEAEPELIKEILMNDKTGTPTLEETLRYRYFLSMLNKLAEDDDLYDLYVEVQLYLEKLMGDEPEAVAYAASNGGKYNGVIYFDLNAGGIMITDSTYTGYVFENGNKNPVKVTGYHSASNQYYIYQSSNNYSSSGYYTKTGWKNGKVILPEYNEVTYNGQSWSDYITNNEDVKGIINNWDAEAEAVGRTPTPTVSNTSSNMEYSRFYTTTSNTNLQDNKGEYNVVIYKTSANVTLDNLYFGYNETNILKDEYNPDKWGDNDSKYYTKENKLSGTNPFGSIIVIGNSSSFSSETDSAYNVNLKLKGDNRLRNIYYSNTIKDHGSLTITSDSGNKSSNGSLTVAPMSDDLSVRESWPDMLALIGPYFENEYGLTFSGGTVFAGFPGQNDNVWGNRYSVNFAVCIGAGNTKNGQVKITGGTLTAVSNGTAAAIGGGGAYLDGSGYGLVDISGGNVYAYAKGVNINNKYSEGEEGVNEYIPAIAIGGGSTCNKPAVDGTVVNITGGNVYAQSYGGVAIGGGNSVRNTGGNATINISGDANVTAVSKSGEINGITINAGNAIGGGNGTVGGEAKVVIEGGTVNATAIGGGTGNKKDNATTTSDDQNTGKGGHATVRVAGGTTTLDNGIGGGDSRNADGGDATVVITDGTINAGQYVGGGTGCIEASSTAGNGGNATIYVTGGEIKTGTIGGGATKSTNKTSHIGYARAYISGGDISGQFLLKGLDNGKEDDRCEFIMTGGKIHDTSALDKKYTGRNENGGAVWMDDSYGIVTISGGTIENCDAVNGGAIYMTGGTFTLTDKGKISNCTAYDNGGAVYLGGGRAIVGVDRKLESGKVKILSYLGLDSQNVDNAPLKTKDITKTRNDVDSFTCNISNCTAQYGGALYVKGESSTNSDTSKNSNINPADYAVYISGGSIDGNTSDYNGGGICVNNGNILMDGGTIENNVAGKDGGGIYLSSTSGNVRVHIRRGYLTNNSATGNGGAIVVDGGNNSNVILNVTIGVNENHYGDNSIVLYKDMAGCEHINDGFTDTDCPEIKGNTAAEKGGAIYISGNENSTLYIYCLDESGNSASNDKQLDNAGTEVYTQSDFLMVEGGKTIISTGSNSDSGTGQNGYVKINSTIHVEGGKLDVYGHMRNPEINAMITVDVNGSGDGFTDHRVYIDEKTDGEKIYWIQYYENFPKDDNTRTGRFRAFPIYKDDDNGKYTETIMEHLFYRADYDILGWNTDSEGNEQWYEAGDHYDFETKKEYTKDGINYLVIQNFNNGNSNLLRNDETGELTTLKLYAIWGKYKVIYGEGIVQKDEPTKDDDGNIVINTTTEEGYHFYDYTTSVEVTKGNEPQDNLVDNVEIVNTPDTDSDGIHTGDYKTTVDMTDYSLTGTVITITIKGAALDATVTAKSRNDQIFTDFEDEDTSISVDSAFTTQFTVSNYIPYEYSEQHILFGKTLPAGSTIILKKDSEYWYYIIDSGNESNFIDLRSFYKMGKPEDKNNFEVDTTAQAELDENRGLYCAPEGKGEFTYQFIVDFSQVTDTTWLSTQEDKMTVDLELVPNTSRKYVPALPKSITKTNDDGSTTTEVQHDLNIGLRKKSNFTVTADNNTGLSETLKLEYKKSGAEINDTGTSIWKNRKTALVLTAPGDVPDDVWITVGESNNKFYMNNKDDKQFIIPISQLLSEEENLFKEWSQDNIKLTLHSNMFPEGENTYKFTADWYVSDSSYATSPLNSCKPATANIIFESNKAKAPSIKIEGTKNSILKIGDKLESRLLKASETPTVKINYEIPDNTTVKAQLMYNSGSGFGDIGSADTIESSSGSEYTLPITNLTSGSYCLKATVVDENGKELLSLPSYYYFILLNENGTLTTSD